MLWCFAKDLLVCPLSILGKQISFGSKRAMFQERDRQNNTLSWDVQVLIPWTSEHARLHDKDELKMQLKLLVGWYQNGDTFQIVYYTSGFIGVEVRIGKLQEYGTIGGFDPRSLALKIETGQGLEREWNGTPSITFGGNATRWYSDISPVIVLDYLSVEL